MKNRMLLAMGVLTITGLSLGGLGCAPFDGQSTNPEDDTFNNDAESAQDETGEDPTGEDPTGEDPTGEDPTGEDSNDEGQDIPPLPDDDAEVVAVHLPTQLDCGATFQASVEMRNIGQATWTRAGGYKLGGVNDQDSLYGPDARVWLDEGDAVAPGETHRFELELTAPLVADAYLTDWRMVHESIQWFGETTAETVTVTCGVQSYCDPLIDSSLQAGFADKTIRGGSFSSAGWQSTGDDDQILLRLSAPVLASGSLEIDVSNFDPTTQYRGTKHQIINMYTSDDGSQGVFETDEAWWNIRTGSNYGTGFKVLAAPIGGDSREEARLLENATWDPTQTYTFTVTWDSQSIDIYLDGSHLQSLGFDGRVQALQHVFIGKDNVFYDGQVGPIYSNLCVTIQP